jgi:hypothetical protein
MGVKIGHPKIFFLINAFVSKKKVSSAKSAYDLIVPKF